MPAKSSNEILAARIKLPADYGLNEDTPLMEWQSVSSRLAAAINYWISTADSNAVPIARPIDGIWVDDVFYFGGHPNVRWRRNLRVNPKACLTLDNTTSPVIVEGVVVVTGLDAELASRVADASNAKYKFNQTAADFREDVCVLTPKTVLVWTGVFENATRFSFPS